MGGIGDVGARIDAEIARTGLSDEEIGPKVYIFLIMTVYGIADVVFKRYIITQKESWSKFLVNLQCMITNFFHRWYVVFELMKPILNKSLNV